MFMVTDTAKAIHNLSKQQSPLIIAEASAIPIYSMHCGTPLENTIIAILIPMPKMPHTTYDRTGKHPKSFSVIYSGTDAKPQHLT